MKQLPAVTNGPAVVLHALERRPDPDPVGDLAAPRR